MENNNCRLATPAEKKQIDRLGSRTARFEVVAPMLDRIEKDLAYLRPAPGLVRCLLRGIDRLVGAAREDLVAEGDDET